MIACRRKRESGPPARYGNPPKKQEMNKIKTRTEKGENTMKDRHLYIRKPVTWAGIKGQAAGFKNVARALIPNLKGRTPNAQEYGRVRAVGMLAQVWVSQWYVFQIKGWSR